MQTLKNFNRTLAAVLAFTVYLPQLKADSLLNSAASFAVLGGSTVTSAGASVLNGNLGLYPGSAITGFGPGIVNGGVFLGDAVARQAGLDTYAAYWVLAGETPGQSLTGQDLGGLSSRPSATDRRRTDPAARRSAHPGRWRRAATSAA